MDMHTCGSLELFLATQMRIKVLVSTVAISFAASDICQASPRDTMMACA